jgi:hypothetical protein
VRRASRCVSHVAAAGISAPTTNAGTFHHWSASDMWSSATANEEMTADAMLSRRPALRSSASCNTVHISAPATVATVTTAGKVHGNAGGKLR